MPQRANTRASNRASVTPIKEYYGRAQFEEGGPRQSHFARPSAHIETEHVMSLNTDERDLAYDELGDTGALDRGKLADAMNQTAVSDDSLDDELYASSNVGVSKMPFLIVALVILVAAISGVVFMNLRPIDEEALLEQSAITNILEQAEKSAANDDYDSAFSTVYVGVKDYPESEDLQAKVAEYRRKRDDIEKIIHTADSCVLLGFGHIPLHGVAACVCRSRRLC